ncbi:hypothetical protein NIES4102_16890 [Chondrocystis sp. NIES-4102]|nr:hypothetical protein NIES4102_16890 [Chondrocystis sp. NIES-4102]
MEEILELRKCILAQDYTEALLIIDELEEMSKDDKIAKIKGYSVVLLIYLIKQIAENRTTRSWNNSILNSIEGIQDANKTRKAKGYYLNNDELIKAIESVFNRALRTASEEAFEGIYSSEELLEKIIAYEIKQEAFELIKN